MCDYCDCRRIPEISDLSEEHEQIQSMADEALRIAKGGGSGLSAVLDGLRRLLAPHVQREEGGIFVEARAAGLTSYLDDLEDDHRRFEGVLDREELGVEQLEWLMDELHRHIAVEEFDLFPAASQNLTDSQWTRIMSS